MFQSSRKEVHDLKILYWYAVLPSMKLNMYKAAHLTVIVIRTMYQKRMIPKMFVWLNLDCIIHLVGIMYASWVPFFSFLLLLKQWLMTWPTLKWSSLSSFIYSRPGWCWTWCIQSSNLSPQGVRWQAWANTTCRIKKM